MQDIKQIKMEISEADRIVIGLGEEFDDVTSLKHKIGYLEKKDILMRKGKEWLIPSLNFLFGKEEYAKIKEGLERLSDLLGDKEYYVISTSVNEAIREVPWREGRLIMPCGGSTYMQCLNSCTNEVIKVSDQVKEKMETFLSGLSEEDDWTAVESVLGKCPQCGADRIFNNIYARNYDESSYLSQWKEYKNWLQGTLNKRVLILELGVTMQYPSVMRWPFEKIAFYNKKAFLYRINSRLYQLSEELNGKGCSIPQNAIDWLQFL